MTNLKNDTDQRIDHRNQPFTLATEFKIKYRNSTIISFSLSFCLVALTHTDQNAAFEKKPENTSRPNILWFASGTGCQFAAVKSPNEHHSGIFNGELAAGRSVFSQTPTPEGTKIDSVTDFSFLRLSAWFVVDKQHEMGHARCQNSASTADFAPGDRNFGSTQFSAGKKNNPCFFGRSGCCFIMEHLGFTGFLRKNNS
jgi:hypothetical protein